MNGTTGRWALSVGRTGKIGRLQFRSATKSSSIDACKLIEGAEHETTEIEDFDEFEGGQRRHSEVVRPAFQSDHHHDFWRAAAALAQLQLQQS